MGKNYFYSCAAILLASFSIAVQSSLNPTEKDFDKFYISFVKIGDHYKANQNNQGAERYYKKAKFLQELMKLDEFSINWDDLSLLFSELEGREKDSLSLILHYTYLKNNIKMSLTQMYEFKEEFLEKERICKALHNYKQAKIAHKKVKAIDAIISLDKK